MNYEKEEEGDEEEDEEIREYDDYDTSSIPFSYLNVSLPTLTPTFPTPFSSSFLFQCTEEEGYASGILTPQKAQSSIASIFQRTLDEENKHTEEEESPGIIQSSKDTQSLLNSQLKEKMTDLVYAMIFKYQIKEPITKAEMLEVISKEYRKQFHMIFMDASKCLYMLFGIDIKEDYVIRNSYNFANSLNLTYEEKLSGHQRMPRNGFLIFILGLIFIEGNCASEESIWEFLNTMGIYDGEVHPIYGEPRKFLTRDLVQENYLTYQQAVNIFIRREGHLEKNNNRSEERKICVEIRFLKDKPNRKPVELCGYTISPGEDREQNNVSLRKAPTPQPGAKWGDLEETSSNDEESSGASQSSEDPEALLDVVIQEKATDLVFLFIYKYRMKEPITLSEIYEVVTKDYENHFPVIFMEASKCLEMTFGIDIKQSDLLSSAYVFVNSLNLTYEDTLSDNDRLPRNAFLIVILGVIFIEGNCASEERIWEFLKLVGVYDGEEHFICGDPREFLTINLVQENYLEYRQVPNSQPPCFEFLWGPRAYAETTKMKVLEFLAKMNGCDPTDFSVWYEEALRDEEERAWATRDSEDGSPTMWLAER
ncbi:hypothetical protein ACRRTK_001732 [Alexandromys fortis]